MSKCKTQFQTLCYRISEDLVAQWCQVELETARLYKSGVRSPCPAELELFLLNLDGRIVPSEWKGFSFRGALMWDRYGRHLPMVSFVRINSPSKCYANSRAKTGE